VSNYKLKYLKSVKLTVVLIIYLILFFIFASLFPQNENLNFYYDNYGKILGNIIIILGFNNFARSAFFIIPGFLFFINLLLCAIHRFSSRTKKNLPLHPGPDIIHFGIMMLLIGGFLSSAVRQEKLIYLIPGEKIEVSDKHELVLEKFDFEKYPDGRPKSWISTVLLKEGETKQNRYTIEVNKPLSIDKYKLYQESYSLYEELTFKDMQGKLFNIRNSEGLKSSNNHIYFNKIENRKAQLIVWGKNKSHEIKLLKPGDTIDEFRLVGMSNGYLTGLKIVYDPWIVLIILSFIIIFSGMLITFFQKKGEFKS
jgi:cytochrome c biogenesis factor